MLNLKKGESIFFKGKKFTVEIIIDPNHVLAVNKKGKRKLIKIEEIDDDKKGKKVLMPIDAIDEKLFKIAEKRLEIIAPLLKSFRTVEEVEEVAKKHNKTPATIYNWIRAYENTNSILSLIPKYHERGGKGKNRLPDEVLNVVYELINTKYLSIQKLSISNIFRELNAVLYKLGLKNVSYSTIRRLIHQIDERYAYKKREGRSKYLSELDPSPDKFTANFPLHLVQIDHTKLDIQIVDETYRENIGRPYITVALDIYSRMVYGFFITLDEPGLYSVGQVLYQGLLPKDNYLKELGVDGTWEIYGVPNTIHTDNAKEFHSKGLKAFCEILGIHLDYRPRGKPKYGGHVERFIKSLNMQLHTLKGTTFSNPEKKGSYKSEKKAIFTLKELEKYIAEWIVNYYHVDPHYGLNKMTPKDKFLQGLLGDEENPPVGLRVLNTLEERKFAKISLLPFTEKTIQKTGVSVFGIKYYDECLIPFIKPSKNQKKEKYIFRYDLKDLSKIYFYHPDLKDYIEIPYRNKYLPQTTKWELDKAKKILREENEKKYTEEKLFETILKLRELENESAEKTKQHRRKKESRKTKPLSSKDEYPKNIKNKLGKNSRINIKKFDIDF